MDHRRGSLGIADDRSPGPGEPDPDGGSPAAPLRSLRRRLSQLSRRSGRPQPLDRTGRGVRDMMRFLSVGVAGIVTMVFGLVWDVVLHRQDPVAAHEEAGPLDLSNPAHVVLVLGGMLVVGSIAGAAVRGRQLLPHQRRPRRTALIGLCGLALAGASVAWIERADDGGPQLEPVDPEAAEVHSHGLINSHGDEPCEPSRADRLGARKLVEETAAGTARFQDANVALAAGYVPGFAADTSDHWLNPWLMGDGSSLDPANPEALIYTQTPVGPVLTGVTYIMSWPGEFGPEVGGCLTRWHVHANLCFNPVDDSVVGELRPDDTCPPGGVRKVPPPALHVWLVDVPDGRFAAEIDHEELLAALEESGRVPPSGVPG